MNKHVAPGADAPRVLSRTYPEGMRLSEAERAALPDIQNGTAPAWARRAIRHVGISNIRLPLAWPLEAGPMLLETTATGTVGLAAGAKGINMSRLMRTLYAAAEGREGWEMADAALDGYLADHDAAEARLALTANVPLRVPALRSGLEGWQYYRVQMEGRRGGGPERVLHLDYVYSSTCPCSLELSEHARDTRGQMAVPHSQRSVARVSAELASDLSVERLVAICREAIPTETQVMVKREDEQAFAELSGANPIFVEDAARLLAEGLEGERAVGGYRVACSHQESLHSHDAVAVMARGAFDAAPGPYEFGTLVHPG